MRRLILAPLACLALTLVACGGGSECNDLADCCANLSGAAKVSCDATSDQGNAEACQIAYEGFACGAGGTDGDE